MVCFVNKPKVFQTLVIRQGIRNWLWFPQELVSGVDAHTLEECIAEEGRLFKEQERCRSELSRLAQLTWLKVEEKEQKAREVQKVQVSKYLI